MKLRDRITIMAELGRYMDSEDEKWQNACRQASAENAWFLPEFVETAVRNIRRQFLDADLLEAWSDSCGVKDEPATVRTIGLVMAGNIPLVGFHDLLSIFISGHRQKVKLSSRDTTLPRHIIGWLHEQHPDTCALISIGDLLKECDAYIATGSDNSARYFEQYFAQYPHIIRRNKTSVAVLDGTETEQELDLLADDIQMYFGLGCRNVTQLLVPEEYDFVPILKALRKYDHFVDAHKYKHNFDYNLTIQIMNNRFYMTNDSVLLSENPSPFSPIGQVNYRFYGPKDNLTDFLDMKKIQCIVGKAFTPFGKAQTPGLTDYADGADTMAFLQGL